MNLITRNDTNLYDGLVTGDLEHLSGSLGAIGKSDVDDLRELRELDVIQNDQRTVHTGNRLID